MTPPIVVAAAIIERDGAYLLTRRQQGVHLEGLWEFPGGKCDPGETIAECLARELREELAVEARIGHEVFRTMHAYPERVVELHFLWCELTGTPAPQLGQEMRWVPRAELGSLEVPPADAELIQALGDRTLSERTIGGTAGASERASRDRRGWGPAAKSRK